jgi:epoxyqueuosine reductase QueG
MAFPEVRGSYMCQNYLRSFARLALDSQCLQTTLSLARYIEEIYDADVVMLPFHRPFDVTQKTFRRIIAPVSFRHAALNSGMGVFGRNTLVITPEWGAMVRFGVLATTLDLESTPPLCDFHPCKDCHYPCVENCPGKAFTDDGRVLQNRCTKHSQPYDVGNYMRSQLAMVDMDQEEKKEFIKSPHFFNLYQAGMGYLFYRCIECTRGCPMRAKRPDYALTISTPINATTLENPWNPNYDIFSQRFSYEEKEGFNEK